MERQLRLDGESLLQKAERWPKPFQAVEVLDRLKLPQQRLKVKFPVRG